jgi:hypothetical protein
MYPTTKCDEFTRLDFTSHIRITSNLLYHGSQYGVEDAETFRYRIEKYMVHHSTEDFVTDVAKDDMTSVEGLYTLVRLDPIASHRFELCKSSTIANAMEVVFWKPVSKRRPRDCLGFFRHSTLQSVRRGAVAVTPALRIRQTTNVYSNNR